MTAASQPAMSRNHHAILTQQGVILTKYRAALIQQRAWIAHWQADIAAGLKPTEGSLSDARASIEAVLTEKEKA